MATVTRGKTFAVTETVTSTSLHQLVDDATVTEIDRGDAASSTSFVTISGSVPTSMKTGELFFDTTAQQEKLKVKIASQTIPIAVGPGTEFHLTNKSGSSAALGSVVVLNTGADSSFTSTTSAGDVDVVGVVADGSGILDDATGRIQTTGLARIRTTGTISTGDFLTTSTTGFLATGNASPTPGQFARALTADADVNNFVTGMLFGAPSPSVPQNSLILWDQSDTCPSGFTQQTSSAYDEKFIKILNSGDPSTNANGDSGAANGSSDLPGVNVYSNAYYTHEVTKDGDPDPDAEKRSAPELGSLTASLMWSTLQVGSHRMEQGASINGNHQHALNNLSNQPAYKKVILCKKD